ncbi:TetR/AcrR family transcriptional regulator [Hoyosella altamirensis]|uniref:AcrR family transcriptional regulator n=1 Tax=Hoyosella altamirensis TaxID=616997 RepID=A0A839RT82_9ACTN|nr:TetR/AcrR family transcriptional regulator [Hoyosella altamirensis]MBB3039406.1 AcrR family transcriptional regulator [Hoyosella altamirensis]
MSAASDEGLLTPALSKAWGLEAANARGPKPALSADRVIQAAISVAAAEGVDAVSMKRVATELGTGPMSLYRHIASKDDLLNLMVDTACGPPEANLPSVDDTWRTGITRWAWTLRQRYQENLWAMSVPVTGAPVAPNSVRWMEAGLQCLAKSSLSESEQVSGILLISSFIRSETTLTAQLGAAMQQAGTADVLAGYADTLRRVTTPTDFPALTRVLAAGVFDANDDEPDFDFRFGLERILDGIETLTRD